MTSISPNAPDPATSGRARTIIPIVFTTILIDFIGFSILIPVLPEYANRLGANAFEIAFILAIYALFQLLFLPAWGWFSDRYGRRPVILVSLSGTIASFMMLAFAEQLSTIYLSRALAGFFAASVGTAQAVITDVTPPNERADGMGKIGAALGVALVLGPALGGILADFGHQWPFYAVAIIAAVNLAGAYFFLPETLEPDASRPQSRDLFGSLVPTPVRLLMMVHDRRVGLYLYLWFHIYVAFAAVEGGFPLYLLRQYGATSFEVGILFAWIGVFMAISQGLLVGRLARYMKEATLVIVGLSVTAVGLVTLTVSPSYAWLYALCPIIAVGIGVAFPSFTSLYSKACDARDAGELLGQGNSMGVTGRVVGAMATGLLMDHYGLIMPFIVAGLVMFSAALIFLVAQRLLVGEPGPDGVLSRS